MVKSVKFKYFDLVFLNGWFSVPKATFVISEETLEEFKKWLSSVMGTREAF